MLICFSWLEALNLCRPSQTLGMFQLHFNIIIACYSPATLIKVEGFPVCYIFQTFQTPSGCYGALASSSPGDFFFSRPGLGMWFMFSTCSSLQQRMVWAVDAHAVWNKREGKKRLPPTGLQVENQTTALWVHYEQMDFAVSGETLGGSFSAPVAGLDVLAVCVLLSLSITVSISCPHFLFLLASLSLVLPYS